MTGTEISGTGDEWAITHSFSEGILKNKNSPLAQSPLADSGDEKAEAVDMEVQVGDADGP